MARQEVYLVPVDKNDKYTPCLYRAVTADELDRLLEKFGNRVLSIVSRGEQGAMAMWACFKSRVNNGVYSDIINAYRLLTDDSKSLVDREHELRHAYNEYHELWCIRYFGSVENYFLEEAKRAREHFEKYVKENRDGKDT